MYGEFGFMSLVALFRKYSDQIPRRAVVADLGSGVGRPLFAAACLRPDIADVSAWKNFAGCTSSRASSGLCTTRSWRRCSALTAPRVELHRGDFLGGVEWRGADVVLVNSAIFPTSCSTRRRRGRRKF